jgi:hypothetical protein
MAARSDRTAILHLGTEKTGTTTIQAVLAEQREALLAAGACYPVEPGRGWGPNATNHHALALLAVGERNPKTREFLALLGGGEQPQRAIEDAARRLTAELEALPETVRTVVFSTEFLHSRVARPDQVERLRTLLAPYFGAFRVIVYIRRQDQLAVSHYSTLLRNGRVTPMLPDPRRADRTYYDFEQLIGRWAAVFGQEAMRPRLFERRLLEGGDVVLDFLKVAGIAAPLPVDAGRQENASLSRLAQAVLRRVIAAQEEQDPPPTEVEMRRFCNRLSAQLERLCPGSGEKPSREEARRFLDAFAESNEAVRRTWFPESRTLFSDSLEELPPEGAQPEVAAEEVERTLVQLLYAQGRGTGGAARRTA